MQRPKNYAHINVGVGKIIKGDDVGQVEREASEREGKITERREGGEQKQQFDDQLRQFTPYIAFSRRGDERVREDCQTSLLPV